MQQKNYYLRFSRVFPLQSGTSLILANKWKNKDVSYDDKCALTTYYSFIFQFLKRLIKKEENKFKKSYDLAMYIFCYEIIRDFKRYLVKLFLFEFPNPSLTHNFFFWQTRFYLSETVTCMFTWRVLMWIYCYFVIDT